MLRFIASMVLVVLAAVDAVAVAAKRPNILWIVADDHAAYVTGAYGNRLVRTPNLDRLATTGLRCTRAFCSAPVCTASRQSFLTGRYPRTIGVTLLGTPLPAAEVTLAEMLAVAGYETAAFGKMHFNSNLTHGFAHRLDQREHATMLRQRGAEPLPEGLPVLPPWRPFRDHARVWLNSMNDPYGAVDADMAGTWFAEQGAAFLQQQRARPFFLMVSFYEPHSPFRYPVEFRGRYDPAKFTVPVPGPEDEEQIPAIFRDLTQAEKQGITAAYYTSTEFMDKNVGVVLDALARSGQADNTLVIYLGDHGYFLGQHGRFEKHSSYEEAVLAPLLLCFPGRIAAGRTTPALVEFIDVVPTVLEACGLTVPAPVQGRSLWPLATGARSTHRDYVVVEYAPNDEVMIRDEHWKLVYVRGRRVRTDGYQTGRPLQGATFKLFDLRNDPHELHNLANEPAQSRRLAHYRDLLVKHLVETARVADTIPATDDAMAILDHCVQPQDSE